MLSVDELLDWTKAEPEEVDNLKALERAAVAYINQPGGRYFGALTTIAELHVWRGGVLQLGNEPIEDEYGVEFSLEEWSGSAWTALPAADYFRDGRLVYFNALRTLVGTPTHLRAIYAAGYDPLATDPDVWDAPEDIKQAVRMLVMDWYMNPQGVTVGTIRADVAAAVQNILRKYS